MGKESQWSMGMIDDNEYEKIGTAWNIGTGSKNDQFKEPRKKLGTGSKNIFIGGVLDTVTARVFLDFRSLK